MGRRYEWFKLFLLDSLTSGGEQAVNLLSEVHSKADQVRKLSPPTSRSFLPDLDCTSHERPKAILSLVPPSKPWRGENSFSGNGASGSLINRQTQSISVVSQEPAGPLRTLETLLIAA